MSTVYERAQEEIRQLEERLEELKTFVRVHDKLAKSGVSLSRTRDDKSDYDPTSSVVFACRDSDIAEFLTTTESLAMRALRGCPGMRVRELYEKMVRIGYEPVGRRPHEVLRTRLLRSRFFQSDGAGVYSLRQEG